MESKAQDATDAKNFRNIFLPSADIIGMKVNMKEKHFNVAAINKFLRTTNAMCPAPAKVEKAKPVTFKDSDLFEQNKHAITLHGERKLAELIKKFSDDKRKITTIKIIGYADQEGSAAANFTLSQMRALSVENFFRNNLPAGTTPINIHSQGVGSTRLKKTDLDCPIRMKKRTDCLAENRRVDIELTDE